VNKEFSNWLVCKSSQNPFIWMHVNGKQKFTFSLHSARQFFIKNPAQTHYNPVTFPNPIVTHKTCKSQKPYKLLSSSGSITIIKFHVPKTLPEPLLLKHLYILKGTGIYETSLPNYNQRRSIFFSTLHMSRDDIYHLPN